MTSKPDGSDTITTKDDVTNSAASNCWAAQCAPIARVASHFAMMVAGYELDQEANAEPVNMNAILSRFMGNGASSDLYVKDAYDFLYASGFWKRPNAQITGPGEDNAKQ